MQTPPSTLLPPTCTIELLPQHPSSSPCTSPLPLPSTFFTTPSSSTITAPISTTHLPLPHIHAIHQTLTTAFTLLQTSLRAFEDISDEAWLKPPCDLAAGMKDPKRRMARRALYREIAARHVEVQGMLAELVGRDWFPRRVRGFCEVGEVGGELARVVGCFQEVGLSACVGYSNRLEVYRELRATYRMVMTSLQRLGLKAAEALRERGKWEFA